MSTRVVYVGRPQGIPNGWKEAGPGMHLGRNIWALPIERDSDRPAGDRAHTSGADK